MREQVPQHQVLFHFLRLGLASTRQVTRDQGLLQNIVDRSDYLARLVVSQGIGVYLVLYQPLVVLLD